jgi:cytochrome P450
VRLSPNELIFGDPQAWKDIYGHRAPGQEEFPKDQKVYRPLGNVPASIISADRDMHGLIRRQLAHGFSDRSMREQAPIIGGYVDLLIRRLRENTDGGKNTLDMREWLNWATFDIIGDLGFGDSFGCLEKSDYHPWVKIITQSIKTGIVIQALSTLGLKPLANLFISSGLAKSRDQHRQLVDEKLKQRMELSVERPDFIEGLIKKKDEWVSCHKAMNPVVQPKSAGRLTKRSANALQTTLCQCKYLDHRWV